MPTIKARIAAKNAEVTDVQSLTVYGQELTPDYAEIDVTDAVAAKLKGNPCIDVMVRKGSAAAEAAPEPVSATEPEPAPEPEA